MIEIERKWLVDLSKIDLDACAFITKGYIKQAYLSLFNPTVRVRTEDSEGEVAAYLTIKGESDNNGLTRTEVETRIDIIPAIQLFSMCDNLIEKTRYYIHTDIDGGKYWELDVFEGENKGLAAVEMEFESIHCAYAFQDSELPSWVGKEVTGDIKYYNCNLTINPYRKWQDT